jgi:cellulose synthase/poly-beta-1,6-N-acetylglucosamine synthase-like glycosyltransferase
LEIAYDFFLLIGFLAVLALFYSYYLGAIFDRKATSAMSRPKSGFKPSVCLIMPCKGIDLGLEANIRAALQQDYPSYKMVIVTDTVQDDAFSLAQSILLKDHSSLAELRISEPIGHCSGKVAALLTALSKTKGQADVYAFLDCDGWIPSNWLAELVEPLVDKTIGATTGFRWYLPSEGGFWSHLESVWNASGSNLLFDERYNFPWGGAMAVRSETLDQIKIGEVWANAISDDLTINQALRRHGLRIRFLPQCTVATYSKTTAASFLEWATRQTALTRSLNPRLWYYALVAYAFLDLAFILGVIASVLGAFLGVSWLISALMLLAPTVLGTLRSLQRCATFRRALPHLGQELSRGCLPQASASFFVPWIMTYCIIRSAHAREIEWRGRKYPLTE